MKRDTQIRPRNQTRLVIQQKIDAISAESKALARESGLSSLELKRLQDLRQNLLKQTHKDLVQAATPENSIFISYSGVGSGLGDMACKLAREYGLHPKTGFDAEVEVRTSGNLDVDESLPQAIMAHIISCDCFLGIWTEDFDAESKDGYDMRGNKIDKQKGYVPSVWMPLSWGLRLHTHCPSDCSLFPERIASTMRSPFSFSLRLYLSDINLKKK